MTNTFPPIETLTELAEKAGQAILAIYNTDFSVYEKSDQSPLTEADMASHRVIVETLEQLTQDIPLLSEESAAIPFSERSSWQRYWLIDPLDGTKEFIKRNGEFTVNIALIEHQQPVLGVVHVPVSGITFYGGSGIGAFRRSADQEPEPISVCPQRRATVKVAGSRSHAGESLRKFLANLGEHEIVSMGSSLKLCLVADGSADIYPRLGPTSEWDTAAAQAVVEGAGGKVTDTQMQPLRYNTKDSLLNPHFLVFGDASVDWSRYLDSTVKD
jgi:3'(2'), 5'-bisphosphate nucleotidase